MTPYYSEAGITLLQGDNRHRLKELPDNHFHTCVTSPPYFGLRDYGTATWTGGDESCDHRPPADGGKSGNKGQIQEHAGRFAGNCRKCGAIRTDRQIGLEPSPEAYVAEMVNVFREVRRCLRDDGTLWLNIGDSYNAYNVNRGPSTSISARTDVARPDIGGKRSDRIGPNANRDSVHEGDSRRRDAGSTGGGIRELERGLTVPSLKPKDLIGIPWMLAFALRADGWYLRADIIWAKAVSFCPTYNGTTMPESVRDRPTKAHEYIFLLSKSDRYHYDADAVREAAQDWGTRDRSDGKYSATDAAFGLTPHNGLSDINFAERGRNLRSVWTVMPKPYTGAHFATFPEELIKPCIMAGCPDGGAVLEPFAGSGTTLKVARDLGRRATGIELNPDYCGLVVKRLAQGVLFAGGIA